MHLKILVFVSIESCSFYTNFNYIVTSSVTNLYTLLLFSFFHCSYLQNADGTLGVVVPLHQSTQKVQ